MPNVGLDGTQGNSIALISLPLGHSGQPAHFDRIAQGRARTVTFHILQVPKLDACRRERSLDRLRLGWPAGNRKAIHPASVVNATAPDYAPNEVTIRPGPGQGLEQHSPHALTRHIAIAPFTKTAATAIAR